MFLKPLITEKSMGLIEKLNEYTFVAPRHATKLQIKKAIETIFKVKIADIKTKVVHGKEKKAGKRGNLVRKPDTKRVIVRLEKGNTISLFDLKEAK
jgi:large subunit ribosomal protein L23